MSRDVTALLATSDCTTAGCPNETDGPDGLCRTCRAAPPRPVPTRGELRALFHDDDQEPRMAGYTVPLCKHDGCDQPPISRHGMYAGLCDTHRGEAEERQRQLRATKSPARPAPAPAPAPEKTPAAAAGNGEAPPGSLTKLAAHVDRTRYELNKAREAHDAAIRALRAAIEEQAA